MIELRGTGLKLTASEFILLVGALPAEVRAKAVSSVNLIEEISLNEFSISAGDE